MTLQMETINQDEVKDIICRYFGDCVEPLAEISKPDDETGKPAAAMINHPARFHKYDAVAGKLYGKKPRSADMVLFQENGIVFVEFKSGKVKPDNLKVKAIEGCCIVLHEMAGRYKPGVDFIDIVKLPKKYIVVYEPDRNSRKKVGNFARLTRARFGLEIYKNRFFTDVKTWSRKRFMDWLQEEGFIEDSETNHD